MKLTPKEQHAITAMLDLAVHHGGGPVKLAHISQRQGVSLSYLEQIFAKLRQGGLVVSSRGPGGGYRLAQGPQLITVADIIGSLDENLDLTRCQRSPDKKAESFACLSHELWVELSQEIRRFLNSITLAQLVQNLQTYPGEVPLRPRICEHYAKFF